MATVTLDTGTREQLAALVSAQGELAVASAIGVSRDAQQRALAGLTIRRGTAALIERGLQNLAKEKSL